MTRALLALALLACGCAAANVYRAERDLDEVTAMVRASLAASRSGGGGQPNTGQPALRVQQAGTPFDSASRPGVSAALTDSAWLRWTTPRYGSLDCQPDTTKPLHDHVHAAILRLRGQAPAWRPGCESSAACWDSVRRQTQPDTVWQGWAAPGARCSVRVGPGEYVATVTRSRCRAWRVVRVGQ